MLSQDWLGCGAHMGIQEFMGHIAAFISHKVAASIAVLKPQRRFLTLQAFLTPSSRKSTLPKLQAEIIHPKTFKVSVS